MNFGTFIRDRRTARGISLRVAAQKVGVDPAHLSRVEAGKTPASEQLIHRLAEVLEYQEDDLLLLAGRVPQSIQTMVDRQPYRAAAALRTMAEMCVAEAGAPYGEPLLAERGERAIEDNFPFEQISEIAEVESWRKEIYRPIYHVHKWWAQRLGSVFRAAILGAASPKGSSVIDLFYEPVRLPGVVVFDPFMGSGTTIGEAQKLGCTVIGRDLNPVAYRAVRVALGSVDRRELHEQFRKLESSVGTEVKKLYRSVDSDGRPCDVLFSGVLEFNNMFASYKGEGTGAVRHMFSHHILKPERTPIEANPWGTPKSSGAFVTLYESRLLRALDYREAPFEIAVEYSGRRQIGRKVLGVSPPMDGLVVDRYPKGGLKPGMAYLSCGDSSATDLPDRSVDLVITDPPFFDNVHYSELADFFFVWQQVYFSDGCSISACTTRHDAEVQDTEGDVFARKLGRVFAECHRVLRDEGLLVFSYHHSREDGWTAVAQAVLDAGFSIVQSQPVKAEMSVAAPKSQAREPIDLDVLIVCRKRCSDQRARSDESEALRRAVKSADQKVTRFNRVGRQLSRNDVQVVLLSQLLVELSVGRTADGVRTALQALLPQTRSIIVKTWREQRVNRRSDPVAPQFGPTQLSLLAPATGGRGA